MDRDMWWSVAKGAAVAAAGAALTYGLEFAQGGSFGVYTPVVVATLSVLANLVRKVATPA